MKYITNFWSLTWLSVSQRETRRTDRDRKRRYVQTLSFCTCCWFVTLALGKVCCTFRAVLESQGLIEMSNLSFRGRPHRCFCMNFSRLVGNIGATNVSGESAASNFRVGVESMFHRPDFTLPPITLSRVFNLPTCILEALGANSGEVKAFIIINCYWVYTRCQCAAVQDRTVQYGTAQYNIMQLRHTQLWITLKATVSTQNYKKKKNQEHVPYTIKTQQRLESKVDESVLKTTWWTNLTVLWFFTVTQEDASIVSEIRPQALPILCDHFGVIQSFGIVLSCRQRP